MSLTDIEEALTAFAELRSRYDDIVASAADWLWEMDEQLRFTHISDGIRRFNGDQDPRSFYGKSRADLVAHDRTDADIWKRHLDDLANRRPFRNFRYAYANPAGGVHHWSVSGTPVYDDAGAFKGYRGLGRDITERARIEARAIELNAELQAEVRERRAAEEELKRARDELDRRVVERTAELHSANDALRLEIAERKRAEQALQEGRDQLRLVTDNLPVWIAYTDADRRFRFANKTCSRWLAMPVEDILGKVVPDCFTSPEEYEKIRPQIDRALLGEQVSFVEVVTLFDGTTRILQITYVPHIGSGGNVEGYFSLIDDISELTRTEAALRQSQKMEAVGQLTGGVAHDFNNLLAIILGNLEILGDKIGDDQQLATIGRAARRGAELTQRLLAFSRQQALKPQSTNLRELVSGLESLFHRTLGEPVDISTNVPDETWPVLADPGQLENALLNLAINARDAMPDGGSLEIGCSNLVLGGHDRRVSDDFAAGDYVQITVRDTGVGMTDEMLEHAFEPFYTTKDVGEGSGLGLSMVYGFAQQSGGTAVIESAPGKGTKIYLYLPRAEADRDSADAGKAEDLKPGQGEAVLVLEDDPDVRMYTANTLEYLGYQVFEAPDAGAAMRVLQENHADIDILLSDVVLPGSVSGPNFAVRAKELSPRLRVVFMTGYAPESSTDAELSNIGAALLRKPFARADLANALRDALT